MQLTLSVVLNTGPDTSTPDPPALLPNVGDSNTTSEDMTEFLYYCINNSHNAHYLSWFFHNLQEIINSVMVTNDMLKDSCIKCISQTV